MVRSRLIRLGAVTALVGGVLASTAAVAQPASAAAAASPGRPVVTTLGGPPAAGDGTVQNVAPLATAAPLAAGDPAWLNRINTIRTAAGLQPVTNDPDWTLGIQHHLTYLTNTDPSLETGDYASAHTENPASPYYTTDGALEGSRSDLTSGATDDLGAINSWLDAPFHAIGILRPALQHVAFDRDINSGEAGLDVIGGLSGPAATAPVLYPGPGSTINLPSYNNGEAPSPIPTCTNTKPGADYGQPGLPLIALLTQAPSPQLSASLTAPGGTTTTSAGSELCVVDSTTYTSPDTVYGPTGASILSSDHAVLLIPRTPLVAGQYSVTITQPGKADISWTFNSAPVVAPGTSTGLHVVNGDGQVTMSWTAPTDTGGEPLDGYDLYGDDPSTPFEYFDFAGDDSTATTRTVTGLTNGVEYVMCVAAFNTVAEGSSTCVFGDPKAQPVLSAPTNVSASAGDGQATVSWTAPKNTTGLPTIGYDVQFSSNGGGTWTSASDAFHTSTATTKTVTGLTDGTSYVFRVAAMTAEEDGPYSIKSAAVTPQFQLPVITSVSPVAGSTAGGSSVAINGSGFTGVKTVVFGNGVSATAFTVNPAATQIIAKAPAHAAGVVNLKVTTPAGSSPTVAADQFTFEGAPVITAVAPVSGPLAGGTSVAIHGTGFTGASAVVFGNGAPAASFSVNATGTMVTAVSPAHTAGVVNLKVTTPVGASAVVAAEQFTFTAAPPVITSIAPKSGSIAGGDSVTITGTGLGGTSKVLFGNGFPAVAFEVNATGTIVTAVSPAHTAGVVNLKVTTPAGTSAVVAADQFTFKAAPPVITGVSPATGSTAGGTTVTITGTGFAGVTAVTFGTGVNAMTFEVSPAGTQITATSPAHAAGVVNIKVTTAAGASATVTADQFKYQAG